MTCQEKILSNEYYDIITDYNTSYPPDENLDFCSISVERLYNIIYVNRRQVPPLSISAYIYRQIPKLYGLMQDSFDTLALNSAGITQVQRPPLELTGKGVVLGFLDTGIRYTDDVFRDEAGNTRILSIWDQNIQTGQPPEGLVFGTEYNREQINQALASENPRDIVPSWDDNGHGTAMASVAAGSRLEGGGTFLGAAPDAEIVVVKLKECKQYMRDFYLIPDGVPAYAENDIMLAVNYLQSFTRIFQRPVIICLGLGTNMGDHKGSSALAGYLEYVALMRSQGVVVCGGNEGNASHHFLGNLIESGGDISIRSSETVEIRVGQEHRGFILELWGNPPDVLQVSVRSPGGEVIPPFTLGLQQSITYGFIYEQTRITIDSILVEQSTGKELITFRFEAPTAGIWSIIVQAVSVVYNGIFHMWLPITEFLESETYFLRPNPYNTLTEPGMVRGVITTSTYDDRNNSFYVASGRGFSTSNEVKPDFAAPGVQVPTVLGRRTGSSLAAAMAAGGAAQFMQWAVVEANAPLTNAREIKNYFIRGAYREPGLSYPNREWGYGRLDLAGTFNAMIGI